MTEGHELTTERLLLRRWRETDRAPFAAMNADPAVMEHFVSPLSQADSDAFVDRMEAAFERDRFGLWAVEVRETGDFIGFTGLSPVGFEAPFVPAVEVGWRLAHHAWGRGYAPEAARAALGFAFDTIGLTEVVSFTAPVNERSQSVMRKIGMHRDPDGDFDHPRVPEGHPIRRHVLWRIGVDEWRRT